MAWKTSWDCRRPGNALSAEANFEIRHRDGRFYSRVEPNDNRLAYLSADHIPRRGRHEYGVEGSEALGNLYDRHLPGGEDRVEAVKQWLTGKFKRQPTEDDVLSRTKSDYLAKKAEATRLASGLMMIGEVLHVEISEPKLLVNTTYFNRRDDMPVGATFCPLVTIFLGEARFGARIPQFGTRQLDAKEDSRTVSMLELEELISEYDASATPVLLNFGDLVISEDVDFHFDGELNRRWRVVSEVVTIFADNVQTMPEDKAMAWMRLRRVAAMRENEVTLDAVDDTYEDLVDLVSSIDIKDRDRARLLAATEWWNEAPITLEMRGPSAPSQR
jgi:hypothetical protein